MTLPAVRFPVCCRCGARTASRVLTHGLADASSLAPPALLVWAVPGCCFWACSRASRRRCWPCCCLRFGRCGQPAGQHLVATRADRGRFPLALALTGVPWCPPGPGWCRWLAGAGLPAQCLARCAPVSHTDQRLANTAGGPGGTLAPGARVLDAGVAWAMGCVPCAVPTPKPGWKAGMELAPAFPVRPAPLGAGAPGDMWRTDWSSYQLVSPVPAPGKHGPCRCQGPGRNGAGSWLVSLEFAVPGAAPGATAPAGDRVVWIYRFCPGPKRPEQGRGCVWLMACNASLFMALAYRSSRQLLHKMAVIPAEIKGCICYIPAGC